MTIGGVGRLVGVFEDLHARNPGHGQVGDDQIELPVRGEPDRLGSRSDRDALMPGARQADREELPHALFVVDDQDPSARPCPIAITQDYYVSACVGEAAQHEQNVGTKPTHERHGRERTTRNDAAGRRPGGRASELGTEANTLSPCTDRICKLDGKHAFDPPNAVEARHAPGPFDDQRSALDRPQGPSDPVVETPQAQRIVELNDRGAAGGRAGEQPRAERWWRLRGRTSRRAQGARGCVGSTPRRNRR